MPFRNERLRLAALPRSQHRRTQFRKLLLTTVCRLVCPKKAARYAEATRSGRSTAEARGCVYASEAATGDTVGIVVSTLTVGGSAKGSNTDGGTSKCIGLAMNSQIGR